MRKLYITKMLQIIKKELYFSLLLVGLFFPCVNFASNQIIEPPIMCKKANVNFDRKKIESDIQKFRRGETPTIESRPELIKCLESVPILKKYLLDSNPDVRNLITDFLGYHILPERLPLFTKQIESFPLKNNGIQYAYKYPCKQYRKIKSKRLTNALINRIKSPSDSVHDQEIYLLGCLAKEDSQAKHFLQGMRQTSFEHKLSDQERKSQLMNINYALAEAGDIEAENLVLNEIDNNLKENETVILQFLLGKVRGFTNCRILLPLSQLVLDERNVPMDFLGDREGKLQIGDVAVSIFATVLKDNLLGENGSIRKAYSLEERQKIYQDIQKELKKVNTCKV